MRFNNHGLHAHVPAGFSRSRVAGPAFADTIKSWWVAYWAWRARRATVLILQAMEDRYLHDIGIDRSEIGSVVYGTPGERQRAYEG